MAMSKKTENFSKIVPQMPNSPVGKVENPIQEMDQEETTLHEFYLKDKHYKLWRQLYKGQRRNNFYMVLLAVTIIAAAFGMIAVMLIPNQQDPSRFPRLITYGLFNDEVGYRNSMSFLFHFELPTAIAITPDGRIAICGFNEGANQIAFYSQTGVLSGNLPMPDIPLNMVFSKQDQIFPGNIIISFQDHIAVFAPDGTRIQTLPVPASQSFISGLAIFQDHLFAADALQKKIYRYDRDGQLDLTIEQGSSRDDEGNAFPGFDIAFPYFSIAFDPAGILWASDTNRHQLIPFQPDGKWLSSKTLKKPDADHAGSGHAFNPVNLLICPNGLFVLVEKIEPLMEVIRFFSPESDHASYVTDPVVLNSGFPELKHRNFTAWSEFVRRLHISEDELLDWCRTLKLASLSDGSVFAMDPTNMKVYLFQKSGGHANLPAEKDHSQD